MKPDNTVCVARTIVTLELTLDGDRGDVDLDALLLDLAAAQSRLVRTSAIISALAGAVGDLRIRRTRGTLELSSATADVTGVEAVLREAGADPRDYRVDVEYARRWGML